VVSRTLRPEKFPDVTVWNDRIKQRLLQLREQPGKDIWLFGGGQLFGSLLSMGLVDTVEVGLIPALIGSGIPLITSKFKHVPLKLTSRQALDSGILLLTYDIQYPRPTKAARKKTVAKSAPAKKVAAKSARVRKR
jgi:dihydrofolate reductase